MDEISTIDTLHNLEVLNILFGFTGRKWTVGVGGFLNLRLLKIEHNSIKHWNMSSDSFPCLEQLVLRWCNKFEEIPSSFGSMPSLQKIEMRACCPSPMKSAVKNKDMQRDDMKIQTSKSSYLLIRKEDRVCLLKKSLYGLKQSLRQWYKMFNSFMLGHGYSRSMYDSCVYFRKLNNGSFVYLLLYVDDMLIAAKELTEIHTLKGQLK